MYYYNKTYANILIYFNSGVQQTTENCWMNERGRTFLCLLYLKLTFYLHNMQLYQ